MTSRERVAKALNHQEPDRVPVDLGASLVSGIMASSYDRLKKHLRLNGRKTRVGELYQMLAEVEEPVRRRLGVDVVGVFPPGGIFGIRNERWKPFVMFDGTEVEVPGDFNYRIAENGDLLLSPKGDVSKPPCARMPKGGYYFDAIMQPPLPDDAQPDPKDYTRAFSLFTQEELEGIRQQAETLHRNTEYALLGNFGKGGLGDFPFLVGVGVENPGGIRNPADWMAAHVLHKSYIHEVFAEQTENCLQDLKLFKQAVGERICAVFISGTDFGTQRGELFSVDTFRELYFPYYKRMNDWVHHNTSWKTWYHSCGSIYRLLPTFVEMGVDVLNPVQCSAHNMEPERLKSEFGDKLVFWGGGIDTQKTLPFGTPGQVREEVRQRIRAFAPGGGFVFNPIHNVQRGVPPENLLAAFEAVKEFGGYLIGG
jgi:uroporphyrinogen-III decarboxylase